MPAFVATPSCDHTKTTEILSLKLWEKGRTEEEK